MTIGWFGLSFTAILSQRKPNQPLYNSHLQLLRAFALALLYVISWQISSFSHKNQAASGLLIVNFFTLQYNSTYTSHCSPIVNLNFIFLLLTLSPLSFTLRHSSLLPLLYLCTVLFISPSSLSVPSACRRCRFLSRVAAVGLIGVVAWRSGDWRGGASLYLCFSFLPLLYLLAAVVAFSLWLLLWV